jgi:signal transduction histidine kinase
MDMVNPMPRVSRLDGKADKRGRSWLPSGHGLPPSVWARRQRGIVVLLWLHAIGLAVFAVVRGYTVSHALTEAGIVAVLATAAALPVGGIRMRSAIATLGLISCSAILVHLSGGVVEAHFHFFAMIGIITLYQDWVPFGLAIAFVAIHHGVASTVSAESVFNHPAALNNPWKWAAIHGAFVLGASAANIFAWRLNEEAAGETEAYRLRLEEGERRRLSALEINDNVVQGLAIVTSALALGQDDLAKDAATRTIAAARAIISDLLGDDGEAIPAGSLRRVSAAVSK